RVRHGRAHRGINGLIRRRGARAGRRPPPALAPSRCTGPRTLARGTAGHRTAHGCGRSESPPARAGRRRSSAPSGSWSTRPASGRRTRRGGPRPGPRARGPGDRRGGRHRAYCQTRLRGGKFRARGDRYDEARDGGDQAMSGLPSELRDLVESGALAHLSTINADGSPQVSVIWVGLDGDDLVSGHMQWYAKLRNIERDPRVVLSFEAPRQPGVFLNPYAVLHAR